MIDFSPESRLAMIHTDSVSNEKKAHRRVRSELHAGGCVRAIKQCVSQRVARIQSQFRPGPVPITVSRAS